MFWLRFSGWLFVLLATATAVVMGLGSRLPAEHTTTRDAAIAASPEQIWPLLSEAAAQTRWRSDVSATEPLPAENSLPCWTERRDRSSTSVCVAESTPHISLVLRTADSRQPVQMERHFLLTPDVSGPGMTHVTVVEKVRIAPAMVRFYAHYVEGEQTQVVRLLADLNGAMHTSPEPRSATP